MTWFVQNWPVLNEPVLTWPILTWPVLTWPVLTLPVLTQPVLTKPVLTLPVLTWLYLSCPDLSWPNLSDLACPRTLRVNLPDIIHTSTNLTCPILSWLDLSWLDLYWLDLSYIWSALILTSPNLIGSDLACPDTLEKHTTPIKYSHNTIYVGPFLLLEVGWGFLFVLWQGKTKSTPTSTN